MFPSTTRVVDAKGFIDEAAAAGSKGVIVISCEGEHLDYRIFGDVQAQQMAMALLDLHAWYLKSHSIIRDSL